MADSRHRDPCGPRGKIEQWSTNVGEWLFMALKACEALALPCCIGYPNGVGGVPRQAGWPMVTAYHLRFGTRFNDSPLPREKVFVMPHVPVSKSAESVILYRGKTR
jgi:hypothetical protein